ncbi:helix-turn-helix transcriptional regulator [Terrabacter sp. GCM10028922]|uniref:helix-turn-helix transcriptional regulator n=1 Tax=Terrabacter sp. GCM10028922 TaxID=3273428 RepID=UPI00360AD8C2
MTDVEAPAPRPRPLWRVEDVAEYLAVPIKTLYKWRLERHGPPCARIGKHLRYVPEEVVAWVESRKQAAS